MPKKGWSERPQKKLARKLLFSNIGKVNTYLTLPGNECMDLKTGHEMGSLNEGTHIIAVERIEENYQEIDKWLKTSCFKKYEIYSSELYKVNIPKIDLAFIDLLGNIISKEMNWMKNILGKSIIDNGRIAITITTAFRNNILIKNLLNLMNSKKYKTLFLEKQKEVRKTNVPYKYCPIIALYWLLIRDYILFDLSYDFRFYTYKESKSQYPMALILIDLKQGFNAPIDILEERRELEKDIQAIVQTCNDGNSSLKETIVRDNIKPNAVIKAVYEAELQGTPGKKAYATKIFEAYVKQQEKVGKKPVRTRAAIKAHVTRLLNI
jgi:hypothetical protein